MSSAPPPDTTTVPLPVREPLKLALPAMSKFSVPSLTTLPSSVPPSITSSVVPLLMVAPLTVPPDATSRVTPPLVT
jgi:hypothetical protein